ncbi:Uma2 family endonuclease [Georgenia sp. 10Sc9-8]|uniref:Uma2 family endonuclease n=1 Tax=Georgenia halotolerans TaxID=3028317 RepID=A0ABT5TZP2_9MICO|nr:Uma2 family endonuclease [Georgenia halotolerans]
MTVMPREAREWTVEDLDQLPDDGLQYELLDGLLLVTPAPVPVHQRAIGNLYVLLREACPPGFEVLLAPLDWRPDPRTSLQPDLLVVRNDDVGPTNITAPLSLAVEVLSPSTRRKDSVLKRSKYEECGVSAYWIVDPAEPAVLALDLVDGRYTTATRATGDGVARIERPFGVEVCPRELVSPPQL